MPLIHDSIGTDRAKRAQWLAQEYAITHQNIFERIWNCLKDTLFSNYDLRGRIAVDTVSKDYRMFRKTNLSRLFDDSKKIIVGFKEEYARFLRENQDLQNKKRQNEGHLQQNSQKLQQNAKKQEENRSLIEQSAMQLDQNEQQLSAICRNRQSNRRWRPRDENQMQQAAQLDLSLEKDEKQMKDKIDLLWKNHSQLQDDKESLQKDGEALLQDQTRLQQEQRLLLQKEKELKDHLQQTKPYIDKGNKAISEIYSLLQENALFCRYLSKDTIHFLCTI